MNRKMAHQDLDHVLDFLNTNVVRNMYNRYWKEYNADKSGKNLHKYEKFKPTLTNIAEVFKLDPRFNYLKNRGSSTVKNYLSVLIGRGYCFGFRTGRNGLTPVEAKVSLKAA